MLLCGIGAELIFNTEDTERTEERVEKGECAVLGGLCELCVNRMVLCGIGAELIFNTEDTERTEGAKKRKSQEREGRF